MVAWAVGAMASRAVARADGRPDLLVLRLAGPRCPDEVRRALRGCEFVREVVVSGHVCRAVADPGTGPRVAAALRAEGLPVAVVILQWGQERPRQALPPSRVATGAGVPAGPDHHPDDVATGPAATPPVLGAHGVFWAPAPAVATAETGRAPGRRSASPSAGMLTRLIVVTTMPSAVGAAR
ncbi:hypothetical protein Ssi03_23690 [Sphaerisporangium siamense]|uniref:Uncharacterized protein n=1 Tax=Sphaerisporangium siamense TaxID=795645 RepID=A0A7W7D7H4_9ACTN|nr:hypothetical protein [Sphaerisporangium siamense]MBB4701717.1 hypothetical protein [Sphaerisporangium siamense]GII84379.1 hypothetical protein Ssi03_23690 [Sphaerisporangium siamense]